MSFNVFQHLDTFELKYYAMYNECYFEMRNVPTWNLKLVVSRIQILEILSPFVTSLNPFEVVTECP